MSSDTKRPRKKIPYHIARFHGHKGGIIKALLHPEHPSHMRSKMTVNLPTKPIQYYRERLISLLHKTYPALEGNVADWLDSLLRARWKKKDDYLTWLQDHGHVGRAKFAEVARAQKAKRLERRNEVS